MTKALLTSEGDTFALEAPIERNGIKYPRGWFVNATPEMLAKAGLTVVDLPDPEPEPEEIGPAEPVSEDEVNAILSFLEEKPQ